MNQDELNERERNNPGNWGKLLGFYHSRAGQSNLGSQAKALDGLDVEHGESIRQRAGPLLHPSVVPVGCCDSVLPSLEAEPSSWPRECQRPPAPRDRQPSMRTSLDRRLRGLLIWRGRR